LARVVVAAKAVAAWPAWQDLLSLAQVASRGEAAQALVAKGSLAARPVAVPVGAVPRAA